MGTLKTWTRNFPAGLDTTIVMPDLTIGVDDTDPSQLQSVRDSLIDVEGLVGSDLLEAGSLRKRLGDAETTLSSGVVTPPAELFANGKLTRFGSGWVNGMKDDFNNSSIGADWTQTAPVGTSIVEDASKLRYTITATASVARIARPVPFSSADIRIFCELSGDHSSMFSMSLQNDDESEYAAICLVKNPAAAFEVWAQDAGAFVLANPPSLSLWLRLLWLKTAVFAFYSTNAVGSPPVDHEWTPAATQAHGIAHMFSPSSIVLAAVNWAAGSCIIDVSKWQIIFI